MKTMRSQARLEVSVNEMWRDALNRYAGLYDNMLYRDATTTTGVERALLVQDAAMALCGSPFHVYPIGIEWTVLESAFLNRFV